MYSLFLHELVLFYTQSTLLKSISLQINTAIWEALLLIDMILAEVPPMF